MDGYIEVDGQKEWKRRVGEKNGGGRSKSEGEKERLYTLNSINLSKNRIFTLFLKPILYVAL